MPRLHRSLALLILVVALIPVLGARRIQGPIGGVVDAVADGINGELVPEGDYEAFADAVVSICTGGPPRRSNCRNHAFKFSWDMHGQKLLAAMNFDAEPSAQ